MLVYGPPRTGTSLLARLLSYQSKFLIVDVGLHFARKYPENVNWDERLSLSYYEKIYFNLLVNSHEGSCFTVKAFLGLSTLSLSKLLFVPKIIICFVMHLDCLLENFFASEPSSYSQSHKKKFNQPDNIDDDYLFSLKTYEMIGGEIIDYNSDLDLPTYEKYSLRQEGKHSYFTLF